MAEPTYKQITIRISAMMALVIIAVFFVRHMMNEIAPPPTGTEVAQHRAALAQQDERAKESAWIAEMQLRVKARLKDPDSAQFRSVRFSRSSGSPVVCGEVNSNNGFGGKSGFQRFVAAGNIIALEEQMAPGEMDKTWTATCR